MIALSDSCEEKISHEDFLKLILPREKKVPHVSDESFAGGLPMDLEYAL